VCNYINFEKVNKQFYLFDSWGTMPGSHPCEHYQEDIFNKVKKRFSKYENVNLIRGLVPDSLGQVQISKIACLSIDMNGSVAERSALELLYHKIVPGGIIYFDDYGWEYPDLRITLNEFFADKPERLLHFPNGNSIVIKL